MKSHQVSPFPIRIRKRWQNPMQRHLPKLTAWLRNIVHETLSLVVTKLLSRKWSLTPSWRSSKPFLQKNQSNNAMPKGTVPPSPTPEMVAEINRLATALAPQMLQMTQLLRRCGLHNFEIMLGDGTEKLHWDSGLMSNKTPTQDQLAIEITHILDQAYPENVTQFMGMVWSANNLVANGIAEVVAKYRKRDRAQVESQIVAILAAFKQGS